jgi:metal-responsive CopG/Arc/MetJ family transcriptional regulator
MRKLNNPSARKIPVNISLSLYVLDAVDEISGRGKRSEVIEEILKKDLHIS